MMGVARCGRGGSRSRGGRARPVISCADFTGAQEKRAKGHRLKKRWDVRSQLWTGCSSHPRDPGSGHDGVLISLMLSR